MGENHFKALCFLLKCVPFLQLAYSINHQIGAAASQSDVYDRLFKVEAQNHQHEKEISLMKTERVKDRDEIQNLRERVAHLEDSTFPNDGENEEMLERSKRPARLLPLQLLFRGSSNDSSEEEQQVPQRFYGPPTNCSDLKKLGYTLNGYYLVKGKDESNSGRIQVTYCRFLQPPRGTQSLETLIGNVEVKTRNAHFYVSRKDHFRNGHSTLTYQNEELNVGKGVNLTTGEFTAPVGGIYHFEFSCLKHGDDPKTISIFLKVHRFVSGNSSYVASTHMANASIPLSGSLTASLRLKSRDIVFVATYGNSKLYDNDWGRYTQFVGWLVEEDLSL